MASSKDVDMTASCSSSGDIPLDEASDNVDNGRRAERAPISIENSLAHPQGPTHVMVSLRRRKAGEEGQPSFEMIFTFYPMAQPGSWTIPGNKRVAMLCPEEQEFEKEAESARDPAGVFAEFAAVSGENQPPPLKIVRSPVPCGGCGALTTERVRVCTIFNGRDGIREQAGADIIACHWPCTPFVACSLAATLGDNATVTACYGQ